MYAKRHVLSKTGSIWEAMKRDYGKKWKRLTEERS